MGRYLVLIYGDEQRWDAMSAQEQQEIDAGHVRFRRDAGSAVLAAGELEPASTATTLRRGAADDGDGSRLRDGLSITDGPFLETKEVLGGFYVLEAPHLDAAVRLASGLAEVRHDHSGVQVHPLVDHG